MKYNRMNLFDPKYFIFKLPLYDSIEINSGNETDFIALMKFNEQIEEFSIQLKENTSYKVSDRPEEQSKYNNKNYIEGYVGVVYFKLRCVRTGEQAYTYIKVTKELNSSGNSLYKVEKIGQTPSIADIEIGQVKDYSTVLGKEKIREFIRALGLVTHGVGIGSFVYLRRIFEFLIEEAHEKLKTSGDWDEQKYESARVNEKIELLKAELPEFLVENRKLYGILSKGIHSLTEEECLEYFDVVKAGIELILDEKVDHLKKQRKIDDAKHKLA